MEASVPLRPPRDLVRSGRPRSLPSLASSAPTTPVATPCSFVRGGDDPAHPTAVPAASRAATSPTAVPRGLIHRGDVDPQRRLEASSAAAALHFPSPHPPAASSEAVSAAPVPQPHLRQRPPLSSGRPRHLARGGDDTHLAVVSWPRPWRRRPALLPLHDRRFRRQQCARALVDSNATRTDPRVHRRPRRRRCRGRPACPSVAKGWIAPVRRTPGSVATQRRTPPTRRPPPARSRPSTTVACLRIPATSTTHPQLQLEGEAEGRTLTMPPRVPRGGKEGRRGRKGRDGRRTVAVVDEIPSFGDETYSFGECCPRCALYFEGHSRCYHRRKRCPPLISSLAKTFVPPWGKTRFLVIVTMLCCECTRWCSSCPPLALSA